MIRGVVDTHVAVKFIYVHLFCGTSAWITWTARCAGLWILPWIIAEGIPVFNDFLGLAEVAVCSLLTSVSYLPLLIFSFFFSF